jgi:hypothetical protein
VCQINEIQSCLIFKPFKNGCYSNSLVQAFLSLKRLPEILNELQNPATNNVHNFIKIMKNYLNLKKKGGKVSHTFDLRKLVDINGKKLLTIT